MTRTFSFLEDVQKPCRGRGKHRHPWSRTVFTGYPPSCTRTERESVRLQRSTHFRPLKRRIVMPGRRMDLPVAFRPRKRSAVCTRHYEAKSDLIVALDHILGMHTGIWKNGPDSGIVSLHATEARF